MTGFCCRIAATLALLTISAVAGAQTQTRVETFEYHDDTTLWVLGQVKRETVAGVETTRTAYDGRAQAMTTHSFGRLVQVLGYHADGNVATVRDGRAKEADGTYKLTALSNWYRAVPKNISYPDSTSISAAVDGGGRITQVTDQNGIATSYGHDAMGRLASVTYPTGDDVAWNTTTLEFKPLATSVLGLPAGTWYQKVSTGNGHRITYFDAMWQPILRHEYDSTDATIKAETTRYQAWDYDQDGRVAFESYPVATATSLSSFTQGTWTDYDDLGRPTSITQDSELGPLTTLTQYLTGLRIRTTKPSGHATTVTHQAWDANDWSMPMHVASPEGVNTVITRDPLGRTTSVTRSGTWAGAAISAVRDYRYNSYGQLERTWVPERGATYFDYDLIGNPRYQYRCAANDDVTCGWTTTGGRPADRVERTYDKMNRVATIKYPDGVDDATYTYTPDGLLETLIADDTTWTYTYNLRRLLKKEEMFFYSGYGITHLYDANGNLQKDDYGVLIVDYAPNALGQPTRAGTWATGAKYYPNGALRQFTFGNGIVHTMTQNLRGMPDVSKDTYGSTRFIDIDLAYDANGNVTSSNDLATAGHNRSMTYDGLDRLKSATSVGGPWTSATYSYDVLDNLRASSLVTPTGTSSLAYTYNNASNRLATLTPSAGAVRNVSYDARGNVQNDGVRAMTWTSADRLAGVTGKETYQYDGHGRRTVVWRADGTGSVPMFGMNGRLLLTADNRQGGANLHLYLGDDNIADVFTRWSDGQLTETYLHTDPLGTPLVRTNNVRTKSSPLVYAPYGQMVPAMTADTTTNDINYTGHSYDTATGLVYMQQRYYDPATGRFLSNDPVETDSGTGNNFNRYFYANNNPYRYVDPDGRSFFEALTWINTFLATRTTTGAQVPIPTTAREQVELVQQVAEPALNAIDTEAEKFNVVAQTRTSMGTGFGTDVNLTDGGATDLSYVTAGEGAFAGLMLEHEGATIDLTGATPAPVELSYEGKLGIGPALGIGISVNPAGQIKIRPSVGVGAGQHQAYGPTVKWVGPPKKQPEDD